MLQFDHVEIFVPDRDLAAQWYATVLGFEVVDQFKHWSEDGPLMLASGDGGQMLALFEGSPQEGHPICGLRRLAVRANAREFAEFIRMSSGWSDPPLGPQQIQDHDQAVSVYFADPFGTPLEVTTYEHEAARQFVESLI